MIVWEELNVGSRVVDTWFKEVGTGTVLKKLKTVVHINFHLSARPVTVYDKKHATEFLALEQLHNGKNPKEKKSTRDSRASR